MAANHVMVENAQERLRAAKERELALAVEKTRRVQRQAVVAARSPIYVAFQKQYYSRPDLFVKECILWRPGQGPTEYQADILLGLMDAGRECVRGPHTLGKTALHAWAILWFALTRDGEDWKCPTTASAWRQLDKFLWPEVHKWARRLDWTKIGREPFDERRELLDMSLKLTTGEAFALASDKPDLIEGAHAEHLLYILDECKAIVDAFWDAIEGAFAGEREVSEALALASSTPGEPDGRFYHIQSRRAGFEDWRAVYVTFDRVLAAGRISLAWAEQRKRAWGETSPAYLNRVLGEFATQGTDGVIPLAWVEKANQRFLDYQDQHARDGATTWPPFVCLGVDVGAGGDPSAVARRHGDIITSIEKRSTPDTMGLVGWVAGILSHLVGYAVIDMIGVGAGAKDRLLEMGHKIFGFNASSRTDATDSTGDIRFANFRALAWWRMRELLDPSLGSTICLPPNDELTGDLTAPKYHDQSNGRIIESKDDLRKPTRLGRSTNMGDAVVQAYFPVDVMAGPAGRVFSYYQMLYDEKLAKERLVRDRQEHPERYGPDGDLKPEYADKEAVTT